MHVVAAMAVGAAILLAADPGDPARADEPGATARADERGTTGAPDRPDEPDAAACTTTEIEAGTWIPATGGDREPETRATLPCRIPVPATSDGPVRITHVNPEGVRSSIERVASCDEGDGYVLQRDGREARLCAETCDALQGEPGARILAARGCGSP